MTKRDFEKHDGVGLALFAAGVFCAALVVPAMFSGPSAVSVPAGTSPGFVPSIAAAWVGTIGAWPSFAFTAPVAVLGARLFLWGPVLGFARHILGSALVAVSLALLLGAFSATAGGAFGARIGGGITQATHVAFGALIGVLALSATVWFVWMRHDTLVDEEPVNVRNPELAGDDDANDDGVSREEAEALLPKELPRVAPAAPRAPVFVPPPSPYPEDVRKRGEIPAGARPIVAPGSAPTTPTGAPATTYRWTAPGARATEAPAAPQPIARETETGERTGDRYPLADEARDIPAGAQALAGGAALADGAARIANVPSASWENAEEDEDLPVDAYGTPLTLVEALRKESANAAAPLADVDELETEENLVDDDAELFDEVEAEADRQFAQRTRAFAEPGTPAQATYAVRAELGAVADEEEIAEPAAHTPHVEQLELVPSAPLEVATEPAAVPEVVAAEIEAPALAIEPLAAEVEELENDEADEDEESDELAAGDGALEIAASAAETLDADEDELADDEEEELADDDEEAENVLDEEEEFLHEALAADELDAEASVDADDDTDDADDDDTVDETDESAAPARADRGEPLPVAGKLSDARTRGQELLDFDLRTAAAAAVPASSVFVASAPERDVVLTPPAVAAERSVKTPAGKPESDRAALLAEVGCLFIDRKRVAVSMLQRQYSMDFDDACRVLDELQSMGLIGPYLGGQSRDILLTREEWLEKVGAS